MSQLAGSAEREIAIALVSRNMMRCDRARIEYEADVVGVCVSRAGSQQQKPLIRQLQISLVTRSQISDQQETHPKAAEPIAVAPATALIAGRHRCRHRSPGSRGDRHIRKGDTKRWFVL